MSYRYRITTTAGAQIDFVGLITSLEIDRSSGEVTGFRWHNAWEGEDLYHIRNGDIAAVVQLEEVADPEAPGGQLGYGRPAPEDDPEVFGPPEPEDEDEDEAPPIGRRAFEEAPAVEAERLQGSGRPTDPLGL